MQGSVIQLEFEGCFQYCQLWLNGKYLQAHASGYTSFTVRLDNSTLYYGESNSNVIAVRTDASYGSGHW
jgi:beta-galactosidase/beta-glucuronidase